MSEVVVLNLASDLTVGTVITRQPRNFKWDEETDPIFLQSVQGNKAVVVLHLCTGSDILR